MWTVWKFELHVFDVINIDMPKGAKLLNVQTQYGEPVLYALVDPSAKKEERKFRIAGTGHPIAHEFLQYVGTFQLENWDFVAHVFEVIETR